MSYVHLAHDCHVGDDVVIANATQCAGHVTIHDRAILSGLNAVHQFVTIGTYAFVGGGSRVNQDIPPYVKAVGNPMELYGLNSLGLQRAGFSGETVAALKRYRSSSTRLTLSHAWNELAPTCRVPEVELSWLLESASEACRRDGTAAGRRLGGARWGRTMPASGRLMRCAARGCTMDRAGQRRSL